MTENSLAERVASALPFQSHADTLTKAATRFAASTTTHAMTVARDDDLYRHLRFRRPETSVYWFDILTWPGTLVVQGDMGTFVFSRLSDMFEFFRGHHLNPEYWAEKLTAGNPRAYSSDRFAEIVADRVLEWAKDLAEDPDAEVRTAALLAAVTRELARSDDTELDAREAVDAFDHVGFSFSDTWEWDLREFTAQYLWSCNAIVWAIEAHDAHRAGVQTLKPAA